MAKAPPAAPPAIAATDGPSLCWMAAGEVWAADVGFVDGDEVAMVAKVLARATVAVPELAVLELDDPPTAPYCCFWKSFPKNAGTRPSPAHRPAWHGFVLQQPMKTGLVPVQV